MIRVRLLYAALCAAIVLLCCAPYIQAGDCRGVLQIQGGYGVQQVQAYGDTVNFVMTPQYVQRVQAVQVYQPQFVQRQFVRQPVIVQQRFRSSRFRQPVILQQGIGGSTVIRERSIGPFGIFGSSRTVIQQ